MIIRLNVFGLLLLAPAFSPAAVDYLRDVKPVFTQYCTPCHGESKQEGGLRVDTAALLDAGGDSGPVLAPGQSARSLLLQVITDQHADIPRMPYKKPPLQEAQIAVIKAWIDQGATGAPADEVPGKYTHWSFVPPVRQPSPAVQRTDWPRNPIDHFILARLEAEKIAPSAEADRITLLRRLSLDLIGLPPTPAEVDAFLQDRSPGAYERAVDRLLASPHYGERWGRTWLDAARYADSNGYSIDAPRQIWKYRDWVIDALNADMPFDRFTIEQLAGDLLPEATESQKIATGFHRNTQINQEGGIDVEQFRVDSVFDRVATTGTVWLGLTVGCAQCHDHKFDPIAQKEYYQFFAFFNNQAEPTLKVFDPTVDVPALTAQFKEAERKLEEVLTSQAEKLAAWEAGLTEEFKKTLPATVKKALAAPKEKRSLAQKRLLFGAGIGADEAFRVVNERYTELDDRLNKGTTTLVMKELAAPRKTTVFVKGDFTRPAEEVTPGTPAVLHALENTTGKANRLDLARWIVSPQNPLTARVIINRVWQHYFGRGLVETENDFGLQGTPPSHPELLDWLAVEFRERQWSLKAMHRLIVTSQTYRQRSAERPDLREKDPGNYLLARQRRLRLDGEIVRDVALAASGLLAPKLGGPPVYPPIPDGVMGQGQVKRVWTESKGEDKFRRGIYTFVYRATPPPALNVFDAPDGFTTCTRRLRSNTPLQALTLMNDAGFFEFAVALEKIIRQEGLAAAFRRCTARPPHPEELALLQQLDPLNAARALLNLDETLTRE